MSGTSTENDNDEIVSHYTEYTLIVDDQTGDADKADDDDEQNECYPNKKGGNTQQRRPLLLHQKTCESNTDQESNVAALTSCMTSLYTILCRPVANIVNKSVDGISSWISDQLERVKKRYVFDFVYRHQYGNFLDDYMMHNTYGVLKLKCVRESVTEDVRNQLTKEACELYKEINDSNFNTSHLNMDGSEEKMMEFYHEKVYWLKRIKPFIAKVDAVAGHPEYPYRLSGLYTLKEVERILKETEEKLLESKTTEQSCS